MTAIEAMTPRRVSDARYERELRDLRAEMDDRIAKWEREVAADRRGLSREAFQADRARRLNQLIEITGTFWRDSEEAYFKCCQRNRQLLPRTAGRPAKHFRWLRTVRGGAQVGRPRIDSDAATVVTRSVAFIRSAERAAQALPQREAVARALAESMARNTPGQRALKERLRNRTVFDPATSRSFVAEVRRIDPARFDRIARANVRYREEASAGWLSDRGKVFITLGEPDQVFEPQLNDMSRNRQLIWVYQAINLQLTFYDQTGTGKWRLTQSSEVRFESEFRRRLK